MDVPTLSLQALLFIVALVMMWLCWRYAPQEKAAMRVLVRGAAVLLGLFALLLVVAIALGRPWFVKEVPWPFAGAMGLTAVKSVGWLHLADLVRG